MLFWTLIDLDTLVSTAAVFYSIFKIYDIPTDSCSRKFVKSDLCHLSDKKTKILTYFHNLGHDIIMTLCAKENVNTLE